MSEQSNYYVYLHKRPDGSVFYVGKGKDRRAWDKQNRNPHWHHIVNKHGGYDVEILKSGLTEEESLELEVKVIQEFGIENLSNIILGGSGATGLVHTEDTRKRMSESHKQRYLEHPEERQKKLEVLAKIHDKMRNDEETRKAISKRNSDWWKNADAETLERLSEIRSNNSKRMWEDTEKRKEISDALRQAHKKMPEATKKERARKLREATKEYYANISDDTRKQMAEHANRTLRSEKAIAKYKEVHLRKLVLNGLFIVESRAEFSRLLGKTGVGLKPLDNGGYDTFAGFFIENYNKEKHTNAVEIKTLDGVKRLYPVSRNSKPVKNSRGEIFLSLKEAADSLVSSRASDQTKQVSITESRREGIKAYGVFWFDPEPEEVEKEILKRLNTFLSEYETIRSNIECQK